MAGSLVGPIPGIGEQSEACVLDGVEEAPANEGLLISEADYWAHFYEAEGGYEWNNGRLEVKPVSDFLTVLCYRWFLRLLEQYLSVEPIAALTALDFGFRMQLPGKVAIRKPDLGVILKDNSQPLAGLDRTFRGTYDLCIEALSDSRRSAIERDTRTKFEEYGKAGVREYFILHHRLNLCAFYRLSDAGHYEPIPTGDGLLRSAVLPGFQLRLADLERLPALPELMDDPVYSAFVLPGWQAERRAREAAEQRAEQEAAARRALEREIARLRAAADAR
jgi:Uma2 family endonuclease